MNNRNLLLSILTTVCILLSPFMVLADGFIIPPMGANIAVKYHHVTVNISNQIAITEIDQVFINDSDMDNIEGIYVFPLPKGATFSNFSLFVDDEEIMAEVLDADSARAYYESIVRRNIDPALLEYMGQGMFRARIFPFSAHGDRKVKISYSEVLTYDNGICKYLYPLNTEKFSSLPLDSVSVSVNLSSSDPVKTIYSPSHNTVVDKIDDNTAKIVYADNDVKPDKDFLLYYTVAKEDIGIHLMTYNDSNEDGFYLLTAAPKHNVTTSEVVKKRFMFVLDRSGSMSGDKIEQAKEALKFCVNSLNDGDLFNIIDFSTEVKAFKQNPTSLDGSTITSAINYINGLNATGGTNINDALQRALQQMEDDELSNMIIFLTDGQPTVGVTDTEMIVENVKNTNSLNTRIFVFGVGVNVNTHFLDRLSEQNHGYSMYVNPGEDIEVAVSSFYAKVSTPVLSKLTLNFGDIATYDVYPSELPDLFLGSQIIQLGRYQGSGSAIISLTGEVNDIELQFDAEVYFSSGQELVLIDYSAEFIPNLWAVRKVGYLLNEIRLHGENEELKNEVIALAKRYGIITPYTSFLVLEDEIPPGAFDDLAIESGLTANNNSNDLYNWRNADNNVGNQSQEIKYIGNNVFYKRDEFWVDSRFDSLATTIVLTFGSEEYFSTLAANPELSKFFAVGENVIVNYNNTTYKVQPGSTIIPANKNLDPSAENQIINNYPNPFSIETVFQFDLRKDSHVKLEIFNIQGRKIRTLLDGYNTVGTHTIKWDGKDATGLDVLSGIYLYRVETENVVQMNTIILAR